MIPGGTCENGITVLFSAAGFLHIWKVVMRSLRKSGLGGITVYVFPLLFRFFCFVLFLYGFRLSSMACLYANMPNVPFAIYEGSWFSSCKCNALINPPSKTSSRQAVSINWGERQQGLILWREIPVECRVAEWRSCQKRDLNFEEMNDWCDFVSKAHVIECDAKDSSYCFMACERNRLSIKITLNSRTEK